MGFTFLGVANQANQRWRIRFEGPLLTQPSDVGEVMVEVDSRQPRPMEGNLGEEI